MSFALRHAVTGFFVLGMLGAAPAFATGTTSGNCASFFNPKLITKA